MQEGHAINLFTTFEVIYCYKCGTPFAVPEKTRQYLMDKGRNFWCPNGHQQHYCESKVQKLEKQLKSAKQRTKWAEQESINQRERADHNEHRRRGEMAAKTRIKNRISHGVCPCCQRTFQNLARHMKTKHPEYAKPVAVD